MKTILTSDLRGGILFDIQIERERQEVLRKEGKFKFTCASREMSNAEKLCILAEEFGEVAKEVTEECILLSKPMSLERYAETKATKKLMREELIQVASVCLAWCEALDVEIDDREDI